MTETEAPPLTIDSDLRERIAKIAERNNQSTEAVIKDALERFVSYEEWHDQIWKEALEAKEEYERTGLHLTGDKVEEWLRRRAAGEDVALPECHT